MEKRSRNTLISIIIIIIIIIIITVVCQFLLLGQFIETSTTKSLLLVSVSKGCNLLLYVWNDVHMSQKRTERVSITARIVWL